MVLIYFKVFKQSKKEAFLLGIKNNVPGLYVVVILYSIITN